MKAKTKQARVVWFGEVGRNDVALVGGKGANLGEMTRAGISVPPGFIVTAESYGYFLERSGLAQKVRRLLEKLDPNDSAKLQRVASQIKEAISRAPMPPEIAREIKTAYARLGGLVAVRSSATAEDLPQASFAGQQRTFLNIQGTREVIKAVQECWASLFEPRAIFYRHQQGFDHFKVKIAVPVQKMVQSEVSGVLFTVEPVTSDARKIAIEAVYGLGEAIVSGEITPDLYLVGKEDLTILEKKLALQDRQLVINPEAKEAGAEANLWVPVLESLREKTKLSDEEIVTLAKLGLQIEEHYQFPQDIEWAKENGQFYIVQTRPVTTLKERAAEETLRVTAQVLLSGSPASPGADAGPVRITLNPSQIDQVKKGDVLVAAMTTPDFILAMRRAVAVVTDRGGRTCHAAIVSRELGIPCVVGTDRATTVLKTGQEVTVDGSLGKVYEGRLVLEKPPAAPKAPRRRIKTKTKVYVNLAEPDLAEAVAKRHVDGVGLLRAEFMIAQIGEHPRYLISQNRQEEFITKLAQGLTAFAKAFHPRPVVYRTTDFKTNEYRSLKGGEQYEGFEENPMLGYRGVSRYIAEPDIFQMEIEAIKRVRQHYQNLWVMIPFVRTVEEMAQAKKVLARAGLRSSPDFKLWMMVEVPSNVILLDKFLDVGLNGLSIGSNDLTQLILGLDRDNPKLANIFDERNEAVMLAIEKVVKTAILRGVTVSICGQAPSVYPEITEKLVEWGITSVSVSPDMIDQTREIVAKVEKKLERARRRSL